jgi:hypothetical protein
VFKGKNRKMGVRPTLANGCSKIKRPSKLGLVVAMNSEWREGGECLRDSDEQHFDVDERV